MGGLIRLIGPIRAIGEDMNDIALPGDRSRELLAALALADGGVVSREVLAGRIWGSDGPEARRALNSSLYRLRAVLRDHGCENWILVDGDLLRLDRHHGPDVDATLITHMHAEDGNLEDVTARLLDLLEDGDLQLADDLAAEWLDDPRGEFARRLTDTLGDLAGLWDDRTPTRGAVDLARRLVRFDAFDERAWRIIIRHHLITGNRSLALRRYRELSELLEDELSVEPSQLTRQLLEEHEETGNFHFTPIDQPDDNEQAALSARISAIRQRILTLNAELSVIASELAKRNL